MHQPAADDAVALIHSKRARLSDKNFLSDEVINQSVKFIRSRRSPPNGLKPQVQAVDVLLINNDHIWAGFPGLLRIQVGEPAENGEAEKKEMEKRFLENMHRYPVY
ncbi:hypothetical protein AVO45_18055 [Ruegeria marisrubri]|uniref:Uncharacterized protein n=1 Tax=Ruegeria marisrubri TaxID=1685379 RepID=A0A0X3UAP7_9RHOB|nr:hypothetical protein AVO45_18055 [Ruegeria marisrubri]